MLNTLVEKVSNRLRRDAAYFFARRTVAINGSNPVISFCFDDFPKSALETGGAILEKYGYNGTYFISLKQCECDSPVGRIAGKSDILAALKTGHEIGCHTYAHLDAWNTKASEFEESIIANREAFNEIAPDYNMQTFAYPMGNATPQIKTVTAKYFSCARGGGQTNNNGIVDLNMLRSYFLDYRTKPEMINDIKNIIDYNSIQHGWLIFSTHDISEQPTRYGITKSMFESIVEYIHSQNIQVLPVCRALCELNKTNILAFQIASNA